MRVNLPDYFQQTNRVNVVQNTNLGFDMYQSMRPVKSKDSKTQEELESMRELNAKLRKQVRDLRIKNNLLQSFGNVDFGGGGGKGNAEGGDGSGEASGHMEKLC